MLFIGVVRHEYAFFVMSCSFNGTRKGKLLLDTRTLKHLLFLIEAHLYFSINYIFFHHKTEHMLFFSFLGKKDLRALGRFYAHVNSTHAYKHMRTKSFLAPFCALPYTNTYMGHKHYVCIKESLHFLGIHVTVLALISACLSKYLFRQQSNTYLSHAITLPM